MNESVRLQLESRGPFRIVVLSPLAPRAEVSSRAEPPLTAVPIDKLSFDTVMERLAPTFVVAAADPFEATAEPVRVELRWPNVKAMRPVALLEQVPVLRALADAHAVLVQGRDRRLGEGEVRAQLGRVVPRREWVEAILGDVQTVAAATAKPAAARVTAAAEPSDPMDALFAKVALHPEIAGRAGEPAADEEPAVEAAADRSGMSALIAAVARGPRGGRAARPAGNGGDGRDETTRPSLTPGSAGGAVQRVERALRDLLRAILQDPDVRQVERAWRGLRLLVDRADTRAGVEVDVVAVARERVEDALAALEEQISSGARAPVDLLVVDHEVSRSETDLDQLRTWGRLADDLHAPLVVNGHPGFLERGTTPIATAGDDPLRWVAVAMNGPLLRAAYTQGSAGTRGLPFSEAERDEAAHVFGGAAVGVAALAAQSYVETGWGTAITGPRAGLLGNLPVREIERGGVEMALPVSRLWSEDEVAAAAREGVAVFTSGANQDAAILLRAPVLGGTSRTRATLGDQLFVGRFAHAIEQLAAVLPDESSEAVAQAAEEILTDLFPPTRSFANVPELTVTVGDDGLEVTVRPRRYAGVTLEELTAVARPTRSLNEG